jgi:hypothetical protein
MRASFRISVLVGIGVFAKAAATKEFAQKALALYKTDGMEAAKNAFMAPKAWLLGPDKFNLHVTGLSDDNEMVWADSGFPEVVGLSYHDVADLDGVPLGDAVWGGLAKSPTGAAIQLRFNDPATKAVAHTEGYCLRADARNVICAWSQAPT